MIPAKLRASTRRRPNTPPASVVAGVLLATEKLLIRVDLGGNPDEWNRSQIAQLRHARLWAQSFGPQAEVTEKDL